MKKKTTKTNKSKKKIKRGLKANYKGATPEQVGRAVLRFRKKKR